MTRFARFVVVGAAATALQYAVLIVLVQRAGLQPVPASTIGFVASALFNYAANRAYTFGSDVPHVRGLARFAAVAGSGLLLNGAALAAATSVLRWHYAAAQLAATALVLGCNFLLHRHWTYAAAPQ